MKTTPDLIKYLHCTLFTLLSTHLDLVSEGSRGVAAGDGGGADVPRGLEHGTLAILARGDDVDIGRVLDGGDGPDGGMYSFVKNDLKERIELGPMFLILGEYEIYSVMFNIRLHFT